MSHYVLDKLPLTPFCGCGEDEEVWHSYFLEGHARPNNNPNVNYHFFSWYKQLWHKGPYVFGFF